VVLTKASTAPVADGVGVAGTVVGEVDVVGVDTARLGRDEGVVDKG